MKRVVIATALAALLGASHGAAHAQSDDESDASEERRLTLPSGVFFIQVLTEISLDQDAFAEPFSVAPDIWYGWSNRLTLGLIHSGRGRTGLYGLAGNGICLAGADSGCAKVYDNVGFDARYQFHRESGMTVAADGGLYLASFDPVQLALKIGALGRWQSGILAVEFAPSLFAGLTNRDPGTGADVTAGTNKETFFFPVTGILGVTSDLGLAGQVGATVPLQNTGDTYAIALSIGLQYMLSEQLFADAAFSLPAVAGGADNAGTGLRTFTLGVGYAH